MDAYRAFCLIRERHVYFRMQSDPGERAWVEYEFKDTTQVSTTWVCWYDDRRFFRIPASWHVLFKLGEEWIPVEKLEAYGVVKDRFNVTNFKPVSTSAMRLEVEPETRLYKAGDIGPPATSFLKEGTQWREFGILEWRVS